MFNHLRIRTIDRLMHSGNISAVAHAAMEKTNMVFADMMLDVVGLRDERIGAAFERP